MNDNTRRLTILTSDHRVKYLKSKDKRLSKIIDIIGDIEYATHSEGFSHIVEEIVGQMLSNKVADVLTERLRNLCGGKICVESIEKLNVDSIRSIGLSKAKSQYIINFCNAVKTGTIDLEGLSELSDEDVMKELMKIQGIGPWTAKMYLLFSLKRDNILPYEDGAFLQSYKWLYNTTDTSVTVIKKKCKKWSPYASIASRYMYIALDSGLTKKPFRFYK